MTAIIWATTAMIVMMMKTRAAHKSFHKDRERLKYIHFVPYLCFFFFKSDNEIQAGLLVT